MRKSLASALLVAVATCATAVISVPAAVAAGTDTMKGGCFFDTDGQPAVTGNAQTGVIGDKSVTVDANNIPIGATVSCAVSVNGTIVASTIHSYSGPGVQAGADSISYDAQDGDWIDLVYRVVYADGTDTGWTYPCVCDPQIPPQDVVDALNLVFDELNGVLATYADPEICPVLAAHPGTYGPITIGPDGDVYVIDPFDIFSATPVYDCMPYGNF